MRYVIIRPVYRVAVVPEGDGRNDKYLVPVRTNDLNRFVPR